MGHEAQVDQVGWQNAVGLSLPSVTELLTEELPQLMTDSHVLLALRGDFVHRTSTAMNAVFSSASIGFGSQHSQHLANSWSAKRLMFDQSVRPVTQCESKVEVGRTRNQVRALQHTLTGDD